MKFTKRMLFGLCAITMAVTSHTAFAAAKPISAQPVASTQSAQAKINLNTADVKALSKGIKGIGVKRASAIVAYREMYGTFKSLDDLTKVKGISKKVLDRYRANWEQALSLG